MRRTMAVRVLYPDDFTEYRLIIVGDCPAKIFLRVLNPQPALQ